MATFDISALGTFTNQITQDIINLEVLSPSSVAFIMTKPDCVGATEIVNYAVSDSIFQTDACAWNTSGSSTLGQASMTMADVKVQMGFCATDIRPYWLQYKMTAENDAAQIPFETYFLQVLNDGISNKYGKAIWQGRTTSANPNLNKFNGLLHAASGSLAMVTPSAATASISSTTIESVIESMYAAIPASIADASDLTLYMGSEDFRLYTQVLFKSNYFHFDASKLATTDSFIDPVNNAVTVVRTPGLTGSHKMLLGRKSNFWRGMLINDPESTGIRSWYSQDNGQMRYEYKFRAGTAILKGAEIVSNFITAI